MTFRKFRARRVDNGKWMRGSHCLWGEAIEQKLLHLEKALKLEEYVFYDIIQMPVYEDERLAGFEWAQVIPQTIGQFTGLTDKNKTEIYEGDIILNNFGIDRSQSLVCRWNTKEARFEFIDQYGHAKKLSDNCEVVGNIHGN